MELNRHFRLGFIGEELTAGLIHDVGRSLLGIVSPNEFAAADPLDFKQSDDRLQREREILQTDHCEMGAWFLVQNNLPEALVAVVHLHHTPALADEDKKLVALTAVADHIADYLQREESSDGYEPEANAAMEVLFTGNQQEVFCRDIQSIMNIAQREANSSNWTFGRT
jgi:HD-like signal output (HDOD) protein